MNKEDTVTVKLDRKTMKALRAAATKSRDYAGAYITAVDNAEPEKARRKV